MFKAFHCHFALLDQPCLDIRFRGWLLATMDVREGRYAEISATSWTAYSLFRKNAAQVHFRAHRDLLMGWNRGTIRHGRELLYNTETVS